ncbi:lipoprotein LpqV [Mycobacterium sp. TY813]|uniref:lipoprotein LpqV n=1 Tax=Mycobacterium TaxID=1763 RepID=UPI003531F2EC
MRPVRGHRRWAALLGALACLPAVAACSHSDDGGRTTSSPARSSTTAGSLPPGAIGISPGGVTTRVDAPAESTEEEYFQACHAAKVWMDAQGGTGETQIEPYLAMVQTSAPGTAGSWNKRWAELGPERQAAVIVAAQAAGRGECG